MNTKTYLRFSLLIPFLIWGVCLLFFGIISIAPLNELASSASTTITDGITWFLGFYVFGILAWIFPYAALALILLALSFISKARVALKVFALSPIAMTLLIIAAVNLCIWVIGGEDPIFTSPARDYQGFMAVNILFAIVSLLWGYICVGVGIVLYRILQRLQVIRETKLEAGMVLQEAL